MHSIIPIHNLKQLINWIKEKSNFESIIFCVNRKKERKNRLQASLNVITKKKKWKKLKIDEKMRKIFWQK